jgi:hypothetical protein
MEKNIMSTFKIWDKVVRDIKFYDTKLKGKHLDFEIINKIWVSNWEIEEINWVVVNVYRKATVEEDILFYN